MNEILFLILSAAISGVTEWDEMEEFGKYKIRWLRKFFPYKHGVPSHDTLGRVFANLDPNVFCECFTDWMANLRQKFDHEVIALDGKVVKGRAPKAKGMEAVYLVSAFASQNNLVLSQKATPKKSNEIMAIPYLLDLVDCRGSIVTADALNCQTSIAEKIIDKKADYLLAIKGSQGEIFDQIKERFEKQKPHSTHIMNDLGHGRCEKRTCSLIDDLRFVDCAKNWKNIKTIVKIEAERTDKNTLVSSSQTRYYITSLTANAELINHSVRSHWSIENQLHWHLDVTFREDQSRKRRDHSAENFSIVLKTVLNLLKKVNDKKPLKRRKLRALLDDTQRENFIFGV